MKQFTTVVLFCSFSILTLNILTGCTKDTLPANSNTSTDQYVGEYSVSEDTKKAFSNSFNQHSNFIGTIIRGDSSDWIKTIQSNRNPKPAWVGWSSDTIAFKIYPLTDSIKNPMGGIAAGKICHQDTIKINYLYGVGSTVYDVSQTWVKNR